MKTQRISEETDFQPFQQSTLTLLALLDEIYVPQDELVPRPQTAQTLAAVESFMQELHSFEEIPMPLFECITKIRSAVFRALFPLFNMRRSREFYQFIEYEQAPLTGREFFDLIETCHRILKIGFIRRDLTYYQDIFDDIRNTDLTQVIIDFYLFFDRTTEARYEHTLHTLLSILVSHLNYDYPTLEFALIVFKTQFRENQHQHQILPHLVALLDRMIRNPPPETFSCTLFSVISMYTSRKRPHIQFLKDTRDSVARLLVSNVLTGRPLHALVILVIDTLPTLMSQQFVDYLIETGLLLFVIRHYSGQILYKKLFVSILRHIEDLYGGQYKRLRTYLEIIAESEGFEDQVIAMTSQHGSTPRHLQIHMTPSKL